MGIQGLLVKLKGITHKVHVREYTGLMAGIDAYCWLHRGAYTCCTELVLGKSTDKYIRYCMEKLQMLIDNGVTPIVVFDGASISVKRERNADRRRIRDEKRERGFELYEKGQHEEARRLFQKAVVITHEMAHQFVKALKAAGIQFVVAPHEADAQLAYLSMKGIIDVVISEDSDTIPYGCRKVLFKLQKDGTAEEIERRNLGANAELDFQNWTDNMFLDMCLLAGCDYLPNVPGIGIMTAYKLVKQHRTYKKVIHALKAMTNIQLPDDYLELFAKARLTFRHHLVYEPDEKCIVPLNPLKDAHLELDLSFLGQRHNSLLAQAIAQGDVHPESHRPFTPPSPSHAATSAITDQVPTEEARGGGGSTREDRVVPSGSHQKQQPPKQWADNYRQIKPAWQTSSPSGDSSNGHVESYQAFGAKTALYSRQLSLQAANQAAHVQANRRAEAAAELQASSSLRLGTAESIDLPNVVQGSANIALGSRRQSLARPSAPLSHQGGQSLQQQLPSTSNTRALLPTWRRHQTSLRTEDEEEEEDDDETGGLVMQYGEEEDEEEKKERREQLRSSYFQQRQQPAASFPSSKSSSLRPSSSPQQQRQKKRDVMMPPPLPPPPPTMRKMIAAGQKDSERSSSSSIGMFDAQAALQRIQEAEQARREEAAAAKRQSKRGMVSFRPPMTSIDFQSPIVSEQLETLHRRKKRASGTIDIGIGGIGGSGGRGAAYLPQKGEQEGGILLPHQVSIFEEKQRREEEERRAREPVEEEEEEAHRVFIPRFSCRFGGNQQQQPPVSIPSAPPQPQPPQCSHQTDTFSFLQRKRKGGATATATAPPMRREEEPGIPMFAAASAAGTVNEHYQHASPYPTSSIASTSSSPLPSFPSRRSREERHEVAAAPPMPSFTSLRPSWSSLTSPPRSESAFPLLSSSHDHHHHQQQQQQQQQHPPPQFLWEKTSPYHSSSSSLLPTAPAFLTSTTTGLTFGPPAPLFNVLRENSPRRGDDINETSAWRPSFAASSFPSSFFLKPAIPTSTSSPPPLAPAAFFLRQPSSLLHLPSDNQPQDQHHHHLLDRPSSVTSTTTALARGEGGDVMYAPSFLPRK